MSEPTPRPLRAGDELTLRFLNWVRDKCLRNTIKLGPNSGLSGIWGSDGTILRVATGEGGGAQLAITDGSISARSGTTPGSGTVFDVSYNGTVLVTATTTKTVGNFSSTTGGIPTGTYVWIEQDPQGAWWITAVDCGN